MGIGVVSNDSKGVYFVQGPSGTILFNRKSVGSSGTLVTGTIAVTGWPQLAGQAVDLYKTLASTTGAVTLATTGSSTTATTGVPG